MHAKRKPKIFFSRHRMIMWIAAFVACFICSGLRTASAAEYFTVQATESGAKQSADGNALALIAEEEYSQHQGQGYYYQYGTSPWCCNFVSWCARQAGISLNIIQNTATVQTMYDELLNNCGAAVVSSPQRGDLVFYRYFNYDSARLHHIGIMVSPGESIQGNVDNTWWKGRPEVIPDVKEMIFVRPAYDGNYIKPQEPYFYDFRMDKVEDDNAATYIRVKNPYNLGVTQVGFDLYDSKRVLLKSYTLSCKLMTGYVYFTCDFKKDTGYTLSPGTGYQIIFHAVVGGQRINDQMRSFTTTINGQTPADDGHKTDPSGSDPIQPLDPDITPAAPGDVNGDGEIGTMDVTLLARHVVGKIQLNEEQTKAADVFADGVINNKDISRLLKIIAGKE